MTATIIACDDVPTIALALRNEIESLGLDREAESPPAAAAGLCTVILQGNAEAIADLGRLVWRTPQLRDVCRRVPSLLTVLRRHAQPCALDALTDLMVEELGRAALANYAAIYDDTVWIPDVLVRRCLEDIEVNAYGWMPHMEADAAVAGILQSRETASWRSWVRSWYAWVGSSAHAAPRRMWAHVPRFLGACLVTAVGHSARSARIFDAIRARRNHLVHLNQEPHALAWLPDTATTHDDLRVVREAGSSQACSGVTSVAGLMTRMRTPHPDSALQSLVASTLQSPRRSRRRAIWDLLVEAALGRLWCGTVGDDGIWSLSVNPALAHAYALFRWRDRLVVSSTMPGAVAGAMGLAVPLARGTIEDRTSSDLHGLIRCGWYHTLQLADPVMVGATTTYQNPWLLLPAEYEPPDLLPPVRFTMSFGSWETYAALRHQPVATEVDADGAR